MIWSYGHVCTIVKYLSVLHKEYRVGKEKNWYYEGWWRGQEELWPPYNWHGMYSTWRFLIKWDTHVIPPTGVAMYNYLLIHHNIYYTVSWLYLLWIESIPTGLEYPRIHLPTHLLWPFSIPTGCTRHPAPQCQPGVYLAWSVEENPHFDPLHMAQKEPSPPARCPPLSGHPCPWPSG